MSGRAWHTAATGRLGDAQLAGEGAAPLPVVLAVGASLGAGLRSGAFGLRGGLLFLGELAAMTFELGSSLDGQGLMHHVA